jgi:hypothetical protein
MNEKEKKEFYIAMCMCCLIAQGMKDCSLCRFEIGLIEKIVIPVDTIPVPAPSPLTIFEMSEAF